VLIERIVGINSSLECIDTNLLHPDDTRTIDLWAWTANPSKIPKRLWLVFTSRTSVSISTTPPERWQRGFKFCVLIHLEWIYDYTGTSVDPFGLLGTGVQVAVPEPERRRLSWHMGAIDGVEAPKLAFSPFNVPPPARERRGDRLPHDGSSGQTNVVGREGRRDSRESRTGKKTYNNDHPRFGNEQRRPDDHNDGDGDSSRGGHRSGGLYGARSV